MKNTLPYILKIEGVKPYEIKLRFNNNELRLIKFDKNELENDLLDKTNFMSASITEKGALCWRKIKSINVLGNEDYLKYDTLKIYNDSTLIVEDKIVIDTEKELTQATYAKKFGLKMMDVMNKVRRGQLKTRYIPELGLKLIVL